MHIVNKNYSREFDDKIFKRSAPTVYDFKPQIEK